MRPPHRTRAFLRAYRFFPQRLLGRAVRLVATRERPRWAVRLAIRAWIRRGRIAMDAFEPGPFPTLEAFFLRRLRPGARPCGDGFVSPADGVVVAESAIDARVILEIKGSTMELRRLCAGADPAPWLSALTGGRALTIFLTPDGYHHLHMPCDGTVDELRWIPGRAFPQNDDALRVIPRVYERNERAVLRCRDADGRPFVLVLVGASLIASIHLDGLERARWAGPRPFAWGRAFRRGDRLGCFSFGSTVVILAPASIAAAAGPQPGRTIAVRERLW